MAESHGYSPEREKIPSNSETARNSIGEFIRSVERSGRRVLCVLGPAIALGGPAFAEDQAPSVPVARAEGIHCEVAWIDGQGNKVGESSVSLPDISDMPSVESRTETAQIKNAGMRTDAVPVGVLSQTTEIASKTSQTAHSDDKNIIETARAVVQAATNQTYSQGMLGGNAYGWTFELESENPALPLFQNHDVSLTTALIIDSDKINDILAGNIPNVTGAYVKIKFKPKT